MGATADTSQYKEANAQAGSSRYRGSRRPTNFLRLWHGTLGNLCLRKQSSYIIPHNVHFISKVTPDCTSINACTLNRYIMCWALAVSFLKRFKTGSSEAAPAPYAVTLVCVPRGPGLYNKKVLCRCRHRFHWRHFRHRCYVSEKRLCKFRLLLLFRYVRSTLD